MSVVPFTDGFPNEPLAAINYSYFLTADEKKEWMDWLSSAKPEQQDELVQILHQMWESAKAENPAAAQAAAQSSQPVNQPQPQMAQQQQYAHQPMQQHQNPQMNPQMAPQMQQQYYGQPNGQPMQQNMQQPMNPQGNPQMQQRSVNPAAAAIASLSQAQPPMGVSAAQSQQYSQNMSQMNPQMAPQMQQQPEPQMQAAPIPEFNFDTEEDVKEYVAPTPIEEPKAPAPKKVVEEITQDDEDDFMNDDYTEAASNQPKVERQVSGIDFNSIRENADKAAINKMTEEYLASRTAHEKAYVELMKKNTKIFSDFEDINDYIEAMTDKVLTINDQVISQGNDIQTIKNNTQVRGSISLQDQADEIKYDIEKLIKEIRNVKIEQKRAVDEIRTRLSSIESNSFRNDGNDFELKYNILKSQVEKLQNQKVVAPSQPQGPKENRQPNPNQNPNQNKSARAERLNSISSKNFAEPAVEVNQEPTFEPLVESTPE
jgi:hypothetical protein